MTNVEFVRKWFDEVWNKQNEKAIYEMFASNGIAHGLMDEEGKEIVGPEKFSIFFKKFIQSFPDIHVSLEDTVNEGEKIVSRCTVSFTHKGDSFRISDTKEVGPSGKKIEFTGMAMVIIRNGQIAEAWNNFDFLAMYMQMGVL